MVKSCILCRNKFTKCGNRSFHKFPKCMERRRKWVKALAIENLPRNTFVCSDHFTPGDFTTKPSGVLWLRKEAVPRPLTNLPVIETRHTLESFPQGKKDTKPYSQAYNFPHTFAQSEFNPFAPRELSEENIDTGSVKIEDVEITEDFPGPSSPNSSTSTLTANSPMSVGPDIELRVIPSPLPNQNIDTGSMKIEDVEITEDFPGPNSPNSSTSTLTANSPMSVGPEEELRVIPSPPPNQNTKNIILIEIIDNSDKTQCVAESSSRILPPKCLISSDGSVGLISTPLPKKKTYRMLLPKPSISVGSVGSISTLLPEEQSSSRMFPKSTISSVESVGSTSTPLPEERCSKMSFPKPTISSIGSVGSISTPLPEERRCSKMLFPEPTISSVESVGSTSTPLPEEREKRKAIRILRYFGDSHIEDMNNPVLARQFYNFTKKTIENQQGKIKHLKRSNRILKKQVCNLQIAVNYLTDKNKLLENKF